MADDSCVTAQVTLLNSQGLHARAAATFVRSLSPFRADVVVRWQNQEVNGRSMLELMTLGAPQGSTLEISVRGPDAEAALSALTQVIKDHFYEE